ncbi:phage baseplate assembly protein [Teichococcus aestuarii]|uniref:phage baseplate assembly protein n=1 Tax=Teichococcus aestuarii TaxID=568898 RepID=UPI0036126DAD
MPHDGELTLLVEGRRLSGWQEIRVSRGIKRCPSDFDITLTERFPGELDGVTACPGSACQVLLGQDVVVTGFIGRAEQLAAYAAAEDLNLLPVSFNALAR